MLSSVLKWYSQGLTCLPCRTNSKAILKGYSKHSRLELSDYIRLFARNTLNACLVTGQADDGRHLVVLDFDNPTLYTDLGTYTVKTRRGYHSYLWTMEAPLEGMESERCEIKSNGNKVMLPGSIVDGFEYIGKGEGVREVVRIDDIIDGAARRKNPMREEKLAPYLSVSISGDNNNVTVNFSPLHRGTGRSPADMLAEIKSLISITDIFNSPYYPVDDNRVLAHCPSPTHLNGDIKPSLSLDITRNRFRCFAPNCPFHLPRGGDVIDAYQIIHNLSFKEAVEELAQQL